MIQGMEHLSYEDGLRAGAVQPGEEKAVGRAESDSRKEGDSLFSSVCSDRIRGSSFELKACRFRLETRKKFFTMRVVSLWNKLSSEAKDPPFPEVFKASLDGALGKMIYLEETLVSSTLTR